MKKLKFRCEQKVPLEKEANNYDHANLMTKLKAKNFLNFEP